MFTRPTLAPGRHAIVWLALALLPAFALTAIVARAHRAEQQALSREWLQRGVRALEGGDPAEAVSAFQTALMYRREDRDVRLRLAQSLAAAGRPSEARAHLLRLWDDQPGNALVNLHLARLAARDRDLTSALRYYRNAIEGAWASEAERQRRATRTELIRFLVAEHAIPQAQAELITLSGNLPPDAAGQKQIAALMLEADLPARALPIYEALMRRSRDAEASAGAGRAAFARGNDTLALRYLEIAVRQGDTSASTNELLQVLRLAATADPFALHLSARTRARRARSALEAAATRLQCLPDPPAADIVALRDRLTALLTPRTLHPDRLDEAMDVVGQVQQVTAGSCGAPTPLDRALRRIAERRQGAGG